MAFKRLEAGAPLLFDGRRELHPCGLLLLKAFSDQAACRTEY